MGMIYHADDNIDPLLSGHQVQHIFWPNILFHTILCPVIVINSSNLDDDDVCNFSGLWTHFHHKTSPTDPDVLFLSREWLCNAYPQLYRLKFHTLINNHLIKIWTNLTLSYRTREKNEQKQIRISEWTNLISQLQWLIVNGRKLNKRHFVVIA